ncbi:hypothetical protein PI124_g5067 [Phytophthora idaei]|nr:hypothetical protein PI124_g5067 [Phytophthora idaei]
MRWSYSLLAALLLVSSDAVSTSSNTNLLMTVNSKAFNSVDTIDTDSNTNRSLRSRDIAAGEEKDVQDSNADEESNDCRTTIRLMKKERWRNSTGWFRT